LPLRWKRQPLPDCPLCEGKGQNFVNLYGPCGGKENTVPLALPCGCVQWDRKDKAKLYDELRREREEMIATEARHRATAVKDDPEASAETRKAHYAEAEDDGIRTLSPQTIANFTAASLSALIESTLNTATRIKVEQAVAARTNNEINRMIRKGNDLAEWLDATLGTLRRAKAAIALSKNVECADGEHNDIP
jgi:hypothetical protein